MQAAANGSVEATGAGSISVSGKRFLAPQPVRGPLEFPCEHEGREKTDGQQDDRDAKDAGRKDVGRQSLDDLHEQPRSGQVGESGAVNVAASKFVEHGVSFSR